MKQDPILICEKITKRYGNTLALNDVNLMLEPHKIYGLLGRNGAGKSTLLHILTAQLLQSDGHVKVFGHSPYEYAPTLSKICFIKESQQYLKNMKVRHILNLAASFYPNWDRPFARQLVRDFQLDTSKKAGKLSRGMESSVGVIIGLASRAELTIFDEPYLGLDAAARTLFYNHLLRDFTEHPRTIIFSTHLIDEVSKLFDEVIMIRAGEIVLQEETDALRNKAYYLSGAQASVKRWASERKVLHHEQMGDKVTTALYGDWSKTDFLKMEADSIEFEPVSLQQLMIYLTTVPNQGGAAYNAN